MQTVTRTTKIEDDDGFAGIAGNAGSALGYLWIGYLIAGSRVIGWTGALADGVENARCALARLRDRPRRRRHSEL